MVSTSPNIKAQSTLTNSKPPALTSFFSAPVTAVQTDTPNSTTQGSRNITKKRKAAGLGVGAYWYSYAETADMAADEAASFIKALKGKQFDYPVYIDLEEDDIARKLGKTKYSEIAAKILSTVESNGYWVGIYASLYYLSDRLDMTKLSRYAVWCAQWNDVCQYENAGIWQYTNSHTVNGVSGKVDADYAYYDYPSQIKAKGLNGYKKKSDNKDLIRTKLEQIEVLANEIESLI